MRLHYKDFNFYCVDINKLKSELVSIVFDIQNILIFNDNGQYKLRVFCANEISAEDELLILEHLAIFEDTDLSQKVPKIYDLVNVGNSKHFHDIDYCIEVNLFPKRTIVKGEVVKVDWYSDSDLTDLIITVDIVYHRDFSGFATYRDVTRTWINRDGSENYEKKLTQKYYSHNPADQIAEGLKRRKLLINNIQTPVLQMMMQALLPLGYSQTAVLLRGRAFLDLYNIEFSKFAENSSTITDPADANYGKKSVIVKFEDNSLTGFNKDHNEWLDKAPAMLGGDSTIRQYLISEFSI